MTTRAPITTATPSLPTLTTTQRQVVCVPEIDTNYPGNDLADSGKANVASYLECCNLCGESTT